MDRSTQRLILSGVVLACVLFAVAVVYLLSGWKTAEKDATGKVRIRMTPPLRVAGWGMLVLGVAFPAFLVVLLTVAPPEEPLYFALACAFGLLVFLGGLYVWRQTTYAYALISAEAVEYHSPWWGRLVFRWKEITEIHINSAGVIVLRGQAEGRGLKRFTFMPQHWAGMQHLDAAIRKHVPRSKVVETPVV